MDVPKVEEIMKIAQEPVSLETPVGEEEDSHLGDFIQDDDASQPSEEASYTLLREQLEDVLATLTPVSYTHLPDHGSRRKRRRTAPERRISC